MSQFATIFSYFSFYNLDPRASRKTELFSMWQKRWLVAWNHEQDNERLRSRSDDYKEIYLPRHIRWKSTNVSSLYSVSNNKPIKKVAWKQLASGSDSAYHVLSCRILARLMKVKMLCPSETSVGFQRRAKLYTPEDRTLHGNKHSDLKSVGNFV
jgi:hypothetical protein